MYFARLVATASAIAFGLMGTAFAVVNTTYPGTTATIVVSGPFGVDVVPMTGTMSTKLEETWKTIRPPGERRERYRRSASLVSRWKGTAPPVQASR